MKAFLYLSMILLGVSSCMKDEIPVLAHEEGEITTNEVNLSTDYRYQAYYDFGTNSFVKQHEKIEWDLGFETGVSGFHAVLNTSKSMRVAEFPIAAFASTTDTVGSQWKYDVTSGNLDSTAIGDWQSANSFYIIDRGYSHDGIHQGFRKLQILVVNNNEYEILFSGLDGSNEQTAILEKDSEYNFTFLSFNTNDVVEIEPQKDGWDIVFGQYSHLFDPTFPYLVTGVLSNRNGVEVAEVFDKSFEEIGFDDTNNYPFSSNIDAIGYDWKTFTGGSFTVHPEQSYIVKTTEGIYFKIHFIDFYNQMGDKGNPKFEVVAL